MGECLCAVILAGGRSSRMGLNKALVRLDGRTLIESIADVANSVADDVVISANEPSPYGFLGLPVVADVFKGQGPMAGLHAAMLHFPRQRFLLLACDMPNLCEGLLRLLVASLEGFDAVIPCTRDGVAHPLCAVYARTCMQAIEENLRRGENTAREILAHPKLNVRRLDIAGAGFGEAALANLNTPEDLERYRNRR